MKKLILILLACAPFSSYAQSVAVCTLPGATAPLPRLACPDTYISYAAPAAGQLIDTIADTSLPQSSEVWMISDTVPANMNVWAQPGWALKSSLVFPVPTAPASATVIIISSGKTTLTWTAPTVNADGTALTNLKNYNVYQGTSATSLTKVGTATTTSYTVTLSPGSYYFAVSAVNTLGTEGAKSSVLGPVTVPQTITVAPGVTGTPHGTLTIAY